MQNLIENTPVIILCGGKGTRLSEETSLTPKPLIKLDKYAIIYHIIQIYIKNGFKNFIVLSGFKHDKVQKYFQHELPKTLKQKINTSKNDKSTFIYNNFKIKIFNTGLNTLTGARILKCKNILKNNKYFAVTYGDGLSNINIKKVFSKLFKSKNHGIMCITNPNERFGNVKIKKNLVTKFDEKKIDKKKWINIGFFIFKNKFFSYLNSKSMLENSPLKKITKNKKLMFHKHKGFYHCIDYLNEKKEAQNFIKMYKFPPWLDKIV